MENSFPCNPTTVCLTVAKNVSFTRANSPTKSLLKLV